jgi:hypothetical protein
MDLLFPLLIVALLVPLFLNARRQKKVLAKTTARFGRGRSVRIEELGYMELDRRPPRCGSRC